MASAERGRGLVRVITPEMQGLDLKIARNPSTGGEGPVPATEIVVGLKPEVISGTITPGDLAEAKVKMGPRGNFSRYCV